MSYELKTEKQEGKRLVRTYLNEQGSEVKTYLIYTDENKNKYWGFIDLYKIPIIRVVMSRHISDLFNVGLSLKDILKWVAEEKALLKSNDPEKYEKLYSLILEKERIAKFTADPIRQNLAVCTVYVLEDEERIDYFNEDLAEQKLKVWMAFPIMVAFFLSWHTEAIGRYMKTLEKISTIASKLEKKKAQLLQPKQLSQSD